MLDPSICNVYLCTILNSSYHMCTLSAYHVNKISAMLMTYEQRTILPPFDTLEISNLKM